MNDGILLTAAMKVIDIAFLYHHKASQAEFVLNSAMNRFGQHRFRKHQKITQQFFQILVLEGS